MKKISILLVVVSTVSFNAFSQTGIDYSLDYAKETQGPFYILIDPNGIELDEIKTSLSVLNDQPEFGSVRISDLSIKDTDLEKVAILVVRRFQNEVEVNAYVELMNSKSLVEDAEALIISQKNYRKFLKKLDIQEYKDFIKM